MDKQKAEWPDEKHIESVGQNGGTLEDEGRALISELMALADIRQVIGDPHGKLMQDEVVSAVNALVKERDEHLDHLKQICEIVGEVHDGKHDIGVAWESVAAIKHQRDELAAHLELIKQAEQRRYPSDQGEWVGSYLNRVRDVIKQAPAVSLAELKAQAIEQFADQWNYETGGDNQFIGYAYSHADRIRQEAQCNN